VLVAVAVRVGVTVGDPVTVGVAVRVDVTIAVNVLVAVAVRVGVIVRVMVKVLVAVAVLVGAGTAPTGSGDDSNETTPRRRIGTAARMRRTQLVLIPRLSDPSRTLVSTTRPVEILTGRRSGRTPTRTTTGCMSVLHQCTK